MQKIGEATAKAIVHAPIESINLGEWMFTITSEEYAACAKAHQSAAQGKLASGKRFSVNLETTEDILIVQHYLETVSQRDHVVGFSPNSMFWLSDTEYALAEVTWEVKVVRIDETCCELICRAFSETEDKAFVAMLHEALKKAPAGYNPLQQHIEEETPMFAKDIQRKALAGVWA